MNDDLISRSALKKAMWEESYFIATFTECGTEEARLGLTFSDIENIIVNAPTVEQDCYITGAQWDEFMKEHRRPHGEWIDGYCNKCGASSLCDGWGRDVESRFCPHCGADMREGKE